MLHPAFCHQTEDTCQVSLPDVTKTLLTDVEIWVLRKCMSDRDGFVRFMKAAGLHTTNVDLCLDLFHLATFLSTVNQYQVNKQFLIFMSPDQTIGGILPIFSQPECLFICTSVCKL